MKKLVFLRTLFLSAALTAGLMSFACDDDDDSPVAPREPDTVTATPTTTPTATPMTTDTPRPSPTPSPTAAP